jgi:hypothetical protein
MRTLCIALGIALLVLVPGPSMAQSDGAYIVRGTYEYGVTWVEFDGDHTWVISSNFPDFGCGTAAAGRDSWQAVTTPVAAEHYREHGLLFTRVYHATLAEWLADIPEAFVCEHPYVAEGILSFLQYDNQADATAPGANVWGHVMNGTLTDLVGACKSGIVKVSVLHLWRIGPNEDYPACYPGCATRRVWKGPTAQCVK